MHADGGNPFLSDEKTKKIDKKKFEKNSGIPINSPIFVKNRLLDILVQKMNTGHEKKYYTGINLK